MALKQPLSEVTKALTVLYPLADFFTPNPTSTYIDTKYNNWTTFYVPMGAGGVGTATFTVKCASDNAGTGATAIPFFYRVDTGDTIGTLTAATSAGFLTTAGANQHYVIEVPTDALIDGKPFVAVSIAAGAAGVCAGAMIAVCSDLRHVGAPTAEQAELT